MSTVAFNESSFRFFLLILCGDILHFLCFCFQDEATAAPLLMTASWLCVVGYTVKSIYNNVNARMYSLQADYFTSLISVGN